MNLGQFLVEVQHLAEVVHVLRGECFLGVHHVVEVRDGDHGLVFG